MPGLAGAVVVVGDGESTTGPTRRCSTIYGAPQSEGTKGGGQRAPEPVKITRTVLNAIFASSNSERL